MEEFKKVGHENITGYTYHSVALLISNLCEETFKQLINKIDR